MLEERINHVRKRASQYPVFVETDVGQPRPDSVEVLTAVGMTFVYVPFFEFKKALWMFSNKNWAEKFVFRFGGKIRTEPPKEVKP